MLPLLKHCSHSLSLSCFAFLFFAALPISDNYAQLNKIGERVTRKIDTKINNKILSQPGKIQRKGERKLNEAVDKTVDSFLDPKSYKTQKKNTVKAEKQKVKAEKQEYKERQKYEKYAKKKGIKYIDPLEKSPEELAFIARRDSLQKHYEMNSKLAANSYYNNFEGAFIWNVEYFNIQKTKAGVDTLIPIPNKNYTLTFYGEEGAIALQSAKKGAKEIEYSYLVYHDPGFEEIQNPRTQEYERFPKDFWSFNFINHKSNEFKYLKYSSCFTDNDSLVYTPDIFQHFKGWQTDSILLTKHIAENDDYKVEVWGDLSVRSNVVHAFNTICRYTRFREDLSFLQPLHMLRMPIYYAGILFKNTGEYCMISMVDHWDVKVSITAMKAKEEEAKAQAAALEAAGVDAEALAAEAAAQKAEEDKKAAEAAQKANAQKGKKNSKSPAKNDARTFVTQEESKGIAEIKYNNFKSSIFKQPTDNTPSLKQNENMDLIQTKAKVVSDEKWEAAQRYLEEGVWLKSIKSSETHEAKID